ncbi:MAG: WS/DGAT domain-containing protein, partial [Pseudomonadota bacterium]|nr:WS/DGAT domain-containing protein [Pseudomonadota bacterium]
LQGTPRGAQVSAKERLTQLMGLPRRAINLIPGVVRQLKVTVEDYRVQNPNLITSFQAPLTLFNQPITGSRHFAIRSYSTSRIKAVAARLGGTSNDVLLALCSSALRQYLVLHKVLPDVPLVAAVPVSIRQDDGDAGNEIAAALVSLATDMAGPIERFNAIKSCMDYNKQRMRQMSPAELLAHSAAMLAPGLFTLLPGAKRTVANVVISHVRGPDCPMYWQGCLLEGVYPASLSLNGFALNITMVSRHDNIDFGLLACRRTVPRIEVILDSIEDALVELELAVPQTSAGKPASGQIAATPVTRTRAIAAKPARHGAKRAVSS